MTLLIKLCDEALRRIRRKQVASQQPAFVIGVGVLVKIELASHPLSPARMPARQGFPVAISLCGCLLPGASFAKFPRSLKLPQGFSSNWTYWTKAWSANGLCESVRSIDSLSF
ncbi:MAG: hypothetical protein CBB71_05860 [Rhodopirellula sp. TMED11]|nr:MAG: hypothetical protein CBB71_05860 [Rhodopirellula sp. TMED11]